MKTKKEIRDKMSEAINAYDEAEPIEQDRLEQVITTLKWILGIKIIEEPIDPVERE